MTLKLDLNSDKYFVAIKDIILKIFNNNVRIILFGSRSTGDNSNNSDYDIAVISNDKNKLFKISQIKDELENSNIPFKIDIIDYESVSRSFKDNIMKDGIEWTD